MDNTLAGLNLALENCKAAGNYGVTLTFGEDIGCDDIGGEHAGRRVGIWANPVGHVGECRIFLRSTVGKCPGFEWGSTPTVVHNPPCRADLREPGFYIWGTERAVNQYLHTLVQGKFA